jgi:ribonuclease-3
MKKLENKIGYRFRAPDLLEEALRHASTAEGTTRKSYQRLEYLGDAVLNLCVAEETYRTFPSAEEGTLSKARSALINNRNLVRVGEMIGVPDALRIDISVREKGGGVTRKMVADAVEAIAGAIFLDGGYDAARRFVLFHFWAGKEVEALVAGFDAKSRLQETPGVPPEVSSDFRPGAAPFPDIYRLRKAIGRQGRERHWEDEERGGNGSRRAPAGASGRRGWKPRGGFMRSGGTGMETGRK